MFLRLLPFALAFLAKKLRTQQTKTKQGTSKHGTTQGSTPARGRRAR